VTLKAVLVSIHTQQGSESALFQTNCHLKPFWSHATFLHRYTHTLTHMTDLQWMSAREIGHRKTGPRRGQCVELGTDDILWVL